jgi:hypothetical protein
MRALSPAAAIAQALDCFDLLDVQWINRMYRQAIRSGPDVRQSLDDFDAAGWSLQTQIVAEIEQLHAGWPQQEVDKSHTPMALGAAGEIVAVTDPLGVADAVHPIRGIAEHGAGSAHNFLQIPKNEAKRNRNGLRSRSICGRRVLTARLLGARGEQVEPTLEQEAPELAQLPLIFGEFVDKLGFCSGTEHLPEGRGIGAMRSRRI